MARNTTSEKGSGTGGKYSNKKGRVLSDKDIKGSGGSNRPLILALAGFTALVIVVLVVFAVLSTTGGQSAENFTANNQGLIGEGEVAPGFSGENINGGGNVTLDGDQNTTMLVFFASWCPHCQNEAPIISELEEQYEADGLRVIMAGIDDTQGDTPEAVQGFVENFDISSQTVYQPELAQEYSVTGYPTVYVLDGENRVVGSHSGEAPREVFEGWIEDALAA